MIELVAGLPGSVVGALAKGEVTATDYEDVLIPAIRNASRSHPRLRFYYEFGPGFTGMDQASMWEDFEVGVEHWAKWDRIAVVTDIPWLNNAVNAFSFLIPCTARVFAMDERDEARSWITAQ
jgi:hypothetical protein